MDMSQDQAQKAAQDEHAKAKRLNDDAQQKEQEIQKLRKEMDSEQKKANLSHLGGVAGSLLGTGARSEANQLEKDIKRIEGEVNKLQEKAKFAEKQAHKFEQTAKYADS